MGFDSDTYKSQDEALYLLQAADVEILLIESQYLY